MNYLLRIMLCSISVMGIYGADPTKKSAHQPEIVTRNLRETKKCNGRCSTCCFDCGTTIFLPRSQGANTARELVGWQKQLFIPYLAEDYVAFAGTAEYTRSFDACALAKRIFCTSCLTFSGSQAKGRKNGSEIVADNFGLPQNFRGTLAIKPFIENYIVDLTMYFGLDEFFPGLYLRAHFPITHTRWSLGLDDCKPCGDKFRGDDSFPDCYMFSNTTPTQPSFAFGDNNTTCFVNNAVNPLQVLSPTPLNPSGPLQFTNNNCTTHSIREALSGDFTFGDMQERWKFGRFDFCPRNKTGLADIDVILGLNFWQSDFGHFGIFGLVVVPTGTKPKSKFVFEPIVGNGRHTELGAGFSMHFSLFSGTRKEGRNLSFYLEGNITHLFTVDQIRSFDFIQNGLLSRYSLLKEFDVNNNYLGRMINAINFATRNADVTIPYKIDVSAKLVFGFGGWDIDLGYNIYAQGREQVCIETECPCDIDQRRFGIKGTQGVCCMSHMVMDGMVMPIPANEQNPTPLVNGTDPHATMFTAHPPKSAPLPPNPTSVCLAYNSKMLSNQMVPLSELTPKNGFVIAQNRPVKIISCRDLDPNSAAQCSMLTHKLFWHFVRTWYTTYYSPHIGIGGEIEFNGKRPNNALSQWGIWLKGGLTF